MDVTRADDNIQVVTVLTVDAFPGPTRPTRRRRHHDDSLIGHLASAVSVREGVRVDPALAFSRG